MIDGLIAATFAARNLAHLTHWNTGSYAEHVALSNFYDSLPDMVDDFVECYQGRFGKVGMVKLVPATGKILDLLKEDVEWMQDNCDDLCKGYGALENLLQNISELYLRTMYKLENLS